MQDDQNKPYICPQQAEADRLMEEELRKLRDEPEPDEGGPSEPDPLGMDDDPLGMATTGEERSLDRGELLRKSRAENPAEKGPQSDPEDGSSEDPYAGVEPASKEEITAVPKRGDESDLNEDFDRYAKAAEMTVDEVEKAFHEMRLKLHSVDLTIKRSHAFHISPVILDLIRLISRQTSMSIGEVVETSALMFFQTVLNEENNMLNDLGLAMDSFTLQNQELAIEADKLADLATMAMESEYSPLEGKHFPEITAKDKEDA